MSLDGPLSALNAARLNPQLARAYGVARTPAARPTEAPAATAPVARLQRTDAADRVDLRPATRPVEATAATTGLRLPAAMQQRVEGLVAGRVAGKVDFGTASTPSTPGGPYQLYTRAADKVELSTVTGGRGGRLDVTV